MGKTQDDVVVYTRTDGTQGQVPFRKETRFDEQSAAGHRPITPQLLHQLAGTLFEWQPAAGRTFMATNS